MLSQDSIDFARSLMMSVDPQQAWGIGNGIPDDSAVMLKNGWYDLGDYDGNVVWRVNSEGLVELPTGRRYLLAVFSDGWTNQQAGVDAIEAISGTVAAAWQ